METNSQQPILEARSITCLLGEGVGQVQAVQNLDLALKPGEMVSVVGPSGCGKSSLLYALGLLDHVQSGEILINGQATSTLAAEARTALRRKSLGFVFQFHYLLGEFSALENVLLPMKRAGLLSHKVQQERATGLLEQVGLSDKLKRPGNQLSGGERQRVAIARALANAPSVVLADEPTGNLDQENSEKAFALMKDITQSENSAVLLVTHNTQLAERADRILSMRDGVFV